MTSHLQEIVCVPWLPSEEIFHLALAHATNSHTFRFKFLSLKTAEGD